MSVQLEIDKKSLDDLQKQIETWKKRMGGSAYAGLCQAALQLRNDAMLRLNERKHIVTSRLKNSIYIKVNQSDPKVVDFGKNGPNYTDKDGKGYDGELRTVTVGSGELVIGTNVEYAGAIEFGHGPIVINSPVNIKNVGWRYIKTLPARAGDSFLYWAFKNVNIIQSVKEKMQKDIDSRKK